MDGGRGGLAQSAWREDVHDLAGEEGREEYGRLSDTPDTVGGGMCGAFSRIEDMREGECGTSWG